MKWDFESSQFKLNEPELEASYSLSLRPDFGSGFWMIRENSPDCSYS